MSDTKPLFSSDRSGRRVPCKVCEYRLKRIEIKRGDAIDQIKFGYDDGKEWSAGHDGGKADSRVAILTEGEFLIRVTHERFDNFKCAGAAVEFETNKGRVFSYQPIAMATGRACEQVTCKAEHGKEIISLNIDKGILISVEQQAVPESEQAVQPKDWYVIGSTGQKEDEGTSFIHVHDKTEALAAWKQACAHAAEKKGRGVVLIDAIRMSVWKKIGETDAMVASSLAEGYWCHKKEEEVGMFDAFLMLFKVLNKKEDVRTFVVVVALLAGSSYLDLLASVMTGHVLTMFTVDTSINENWVVRSACANLMDCTDTDSLRKAMILSFMLVKVLQSALYVANVYLHHNACDTKNHELRIDAYNHVLSLDQSFFDTRSMSEIRGSMNVHSINNMISWNIPYLICRALKLVMVIYFMASINITLAAISCSSMLIIKYGVLDPLSRFERNTHRVQRKLDMKNNQIVDESFDMISSIKLFSKEKHHCEEHENAQRRYMRNINSVVALRCIREFCYGILKVGTFCAVLYQGLKIVASAGISAGGLTSFFLLFQQFQDIFGSIKWHWEVLVREFPDIDRFLSLMQEGRTLVNGMQKLADVEGRIVFEKVRFEYPARPGEETLKGLSVEIQPRKMTAIVGDSGAGKSTITKLLMRLYDPKSGSIKLDGVDVKDLDLTHLHDQIAIVPQNPELFNCSLRDNIAYGINGDVTEAQIIEAAKLANCFGFITRLRGGFDTFAGARGTQLSAGQKQRIAIARAAIRKPKILVLDEATSSLDVENERLVQEALERIMEGRTTIVIAHRLCTIKNADEIICMKDGQLVEKGTHGALMASRGAYYHLVNKQLVETAAVEANTDDKEELVLHAAESA
jgi:ATP-binding cassette subfamily B protein